MTESATPNPMRTPHISDELLSAYMDGAVNDEERRLIEAALHSDAETAWRLDALQQTVLMLRALPQVKLPRAYSLSALLAAEQAAAAGMPGGATLEPVAGIARRPEATTSRRGESAPQKSFWEALGAFFGSGNMALRNSAAAAFALFMVLLVGSQAISGTGAAMQSESAAYAPAMAPAAADTAVVASAAVAESAQPAEAQVFESAPVAAKDAPRPATQSAEEAVGGMSAQADAAVAPAAMAAIAPENTAAAPEAAAAAVLSDPAAAAAPLQSIAPPGMGGEGMGGAAAGPAPVYPNTTGGAEAVTGLDTAMAEAGVEATGAGARTAPNAGAAPEIAPAADALQAVPSTDLTASAKITVDAGAAVASTAAPAVEGYAATNTTTTAGALAAGSAPSDAASTDAAPMQAAAQVAAAEPATAAPNPAPALAPAPLASGSSWGIAWIMLAAWALGALALLLTLLWLISRGRTRYHA